MSVSSISSNYGQYQAGGGHQRKQEIDALSTALQSGDISSAQQAFSALFSANSNQASSSNSSGSNSNSSDGIVADISALGKALSSGDLTSAQSAFSSLQEDIQNAPPPPPPQIQSSSSDSTSSSDPVQSLFEQLAEALQSGDLSSAQSAFSSLQAAAPDNQSSGTNSSDPFSSDIASLSSALSSGDISSAQTAFAQLQEDLQKAPPPPPPGGANGAGGPGGSGDQVQQAFSDLATALQNNDLDAAKTAFATLQSLSPDNQSDSTSASSSTNVTTSASTSSSSSDTIGTDLSSLSDALQSGDLTSAQSLFQTLLEDLQSNAPRHPGVHQYSQNSSSSSDTSATVSVSA